MKVVIRVMVTHKGRSVGNLSGNWPGKGLLLHKVLKHWSLRQDEFFQFKKIVGFWASLVVPW